MAELIHRSFNDEHNPLQKTPTNPIVPKKNPWRPTVSKTAIGNSDKRYIAKIELKKAAARDIGQNRGQSTSFDTGGRWRMRR